MPNLADLVNNPSQCEEAARSLQRSTAIETLKLRGWPGLKQYGLYFASFWVYGWLQPQRAGIIKSAYFWLRHIDDVADGDRPLPSGYESKQQYLQDKKHLAQALSQPGLQGSASLEEVDILLVDYFLAAESLGISLADETLSVLETIRFDEERSRTRRVPAQAELDDYFNKLDSACINGALKVAGEPYHGEATLHDLSWAVRIWFNLRDFPKDFREGLVNVSAEDIARYGIRLDECEGKLPGVLEHKPLREWYQAQLQAGQRYLQSAKRTIHGTPFKAMTKLALFTQFVNPADRTFRRYAALL